MFKKFWAWLGKHIKFEKGFIHPELNNNSLNAIEIERKKLSDAIDNKIAKNNALKTIAIDLHTKVLNEYLYTFFKRQYANIEEQKVAFTTANKKWQKYVREVNSTNKLINLNKKSFEEHVKKVLELAVKKQENG